MLIAFAQSLPLMVSCTYQEQELDIYFMFHESQRLNAVQQPIIPVIAELIHDHPDVISLGQGVVYYAPPQQAVDRIDQYLSDPENHKYGPVKGIPPLKQMIVQKLAQDNRILTDPERVIVTAGSNMGFYNAVLAITDPGDEIIIMSPYYFNHEMAITMANCKPVLVEADSKYHLDLDAINASITIHTRAIVTISPNNPTGAIYSEQDLRLVNELCVSKGLYHISDEAYENFIYDGGRHFSPGCLHDAEPYTISLFSLSKAYGFASWRIGYMVAPTHLIEAVDKIQDTILICPPMISQHAAMGALEAGAAYCAENIKSIVEVRQLILDSLTQLGDLIDTPLAEGAFYILLRLHTEKNDMDVVKQLIADHSIAVIPGSAFGIQHGCYLRIAYGCIAKDQAEAGISRLVNGLKQVLR